jgi:hypothetical protein
MINKDYLKRFNLLLEYEIKDGSNDDMLRQDKNLGYFKGNDIKLTEADPIPDAQPEPAPMQNPNAQPAPEGNAEPAAQAPAEDGDENLDDILGLDDNMNPSGGAAGETPTEEAPTEETPVEDSPKDDTEDVEDILTKIVKIHSDKIEGITDYLDHLNSFIGQMEAKVSEIDQLKGDMASVATKVKELTPPTPLESLNKMVKISGGESIEDYWNKKMMEKGRDERLDQNPYYPTEKNQEGEIIANLDKMPKLSDDKIKDSFYS